MNQPNQPPVISDHKSATANYPERPTNIALWLYHKRENGAPFLEGYVVVSEGRKIQVYGHFSVLDKNSASHGEKYPVIHLSAKNSEEAPLLGQPVAWPMNSRKDGEAVNYRTLVVHVGEKTFYPTVFDNIGEDRKHLGFAKEPQTQKEGAQTETEGSSLAP